MIRSAREGCKTVNWAASSALLCERVLMHFQRYHSWLHSTWLLLPSASGSSYWNCSSIIGSVRGSSNWAAWRRAPLFSQPVQRWLETYLLLQSPIISAAEALFWRATAWQSADSAVKGTTEIIPISSGCNQDIILTALLGSCSILFGAGNKPWLGTSDSIASLPLHAGQSGQCHGTGAQYHQGFATMGPGMELGSPEWRLQPLQAGTYHNRSYFELGCGDADTQVRIIGSRLPRLLSDMTALLLASGSAVSYNPSPLQPLIMKLSLTTTLHCAAFKHFQGYSRLSNSEIFT